VTRVFLCVFENKLTLFFAQHIIWYRHSSSPLITSHLRPKSVPQKYVPFLFQKTVLVLLVLILTSLAQEKAEKPKKVKKSKVDPNKPKKPKSAFLFFGDAKRAGLKTVGMAGTEINKKLSEMWKELDDQSKQIFTDQAAEDKKRYDREMRSYIPPDEAGGASSSPDDSSSDDHSDKGARAEASPSKKVFLFCFVLCIIIWLFL